MRNLLAQKIDGHWKRVCLYRTNRRGGVSIPNAHQGQLTGFVMKSAASFFAGEPIAESVDYEIKGHEYRVSRA